MIAFRAFIQYIFKFIFMLKAFSVIIFLVYVLERFLFENRKKKLYY